MLRFRQGRTPYGSVILMPKTDITVDVPEDVVVRARAYASSLGTSLDQLIAAMLADFGGQDMTEKSRELLRRSGLSRDGSKA